MSEADAVVADTQIETQPQPKPGAGNVTWGTGRRKTSIARVRLIPGDGKIVINGRELKAYFSEDKDRNACAAPLKAANLDTQYDVFARCTGGGHTGQAGAVQMGVARALVRINGELKKPLGDAGLLTRDARMKERKKYGQRGARRSFQFSKR